MVSARCPYLTGHIEAARKSSPLPSIPGDAPKAVVLCLEHASEDTVALLVRYLYTDDIPTDGVSGEILNSLAGLAQELMLPRCVGFVSHTRLL